MIPILLVVAEPRGRRIGAGQFSDSVHQIAATGPDVTNSSAKSRCTIYLETEGWAVETSGLDK